MSRTLYVVTAVAVMLFALVVYNAMEYNKLSDVYNALSAQYNDLLGRYNDLNAAHRKLSDEHSRLEADYKQLRGEYIRLNDSYTALQNSYRQLDAAYGRLRAEHEAALGDLARLRGEYRTLSERYAALERDYAGLRRDYTVLRDKFDALQKKYNTVISTYLKWWEWYRSYLSWDLSLWRTLHDDEIYVAFTVLKYIVDSRMGEWDNLLALYRYVVDNVAYVSDVPMPLPPSVEDLESGHFEYKTRYDHIQSPLQTLVLKHGDCEDMAILLYAMITAYDRYVLGEEYELWFMYVEFDKEAHLAVAFPSGKNPTRLTILDPAGEYYTGMPGRLTARDPLEELRRYKEHWAQYGYNIIYIAIYRVKDGTPILLADGDIYRVAEYIRKY
ncbi:MAG: hypothetical protein ACK4SY_08225 [Pyrobaculum sp.]